MRHPLSLTLLHCLLMNAPLSTASLTVSFNSTLSERLLGITMHFELCIYTVYFFVGQFWKTSIPPSSFGRNFQLLGAASTGKSSVWLAERVYVCGCVGVDTLSEHTRLLHIYEAMQIS